MRLFLAFVLALLSMSSTTAQARPVEGVPCARAGAWHARGELQGHNGGLLYAQQRWLDPSTARFLSLDPVAGSLRDPLSTQGFTYAHGNPTKYTDPDGRWANVALGAAIGGVVGCALGALRADKDKGWEECKLGGGVGAVSGALAGLTFGASLAAQGAATAATASAAQLATAGLVSGAVSVGTGAGLGTAVHKGSAEQVITNTVVGTLVGGIGGFVGAGLFGAVAPSLLTGTQRFVGGGLSSLGGDLVAQTTNSFFTGSAFDPLQALVSIGLGGTFSAVGAKPPQRERYSGILKNVDYPVEQDAWAEYLYEQIRSTGFRDVEVVAENTGIEASRIKVLKKHAYMDQHDLPEIDESSGSVSIVRRRFTPDLDMAEAFLRARMGPLKPKQQEWFRKLVDHETGEAELQNQGVPHRDISSWDPKRKQFRASGGAHDLAPRQPPAGFPDD